MSYMKSAMDGACLTCLEQGEENFPLDPAYHMTTQGHWPTLFKGAPMMSQAGAVPAPGGPMTDPRGPREPRLSLREKVARRVRVHRIAAAMFACGAAGIALSSCTALPWWAGFGALPFAFLALSNVMAAGRLILISRHPLFYLLAIRHDLMGADL